MSRPSFLPDWRDASAYRQLETADRAVLCWEWLRRNRDYQHAARTEDPSRALAWGLHRFEDPEFGAPDARPIWTASRFREVVSAIAFPSADDEDAFIADRLRPWVTTVSDGSQHVSLSNGFQMVRLDVRGRSIADGPVRLHYRLGGIASLARALAVLNRFRLLVVTGRFAAEPGSRAKHARAVLVLRAFDALEARASQREIAAVLLRSEASSPRWRSAFPSLRSQVQRLVKAAREMGQGQYWTLLH